MGHIRRYCKKLQSDGQQPKASVRFPSAHAVHNATAAAASSANDWLVDNRASYHMSPNLAGFETYQSSADFDCNVPSVRVADGSHALVAGIGTVRLCTVIHTAAGSGLQQHTLTKVLHVPSVTTRLPGVELGS
jgi:hypothetical protein